MNMQEDNSAVVEELREQVAWLRRQVELANVTIEALALAANSRDTVAYRTVPSSTVPQ